MRSPAQGVGVQVVSNRVEKRGRATEHVAFNVAAGRQSRKEGFVDLADRTGKFIFQYAVQLEFLPGGDPQAPVAQRLCEVIAGQVLVSIELTADNSDPNHELMGGLLALFFQLLSDVAIVLLVGAMKLENGGSLFAEMRGAIIYFIGHIGLQVLARQLDRFGLARLDDTTLFGRLHLGPSLLTTTNVVAALVVMFTDIHRRPLQS